MENIYFDPKHPASFGGVRKLQKALPKEKRRDAAQWLKGERTYTLHKQARKKFITRKTRTSHHLAQWQVDLNDMISHKDGAYRYILTVIDVFSRYAWARPLKTKKGVEIVQAFTEIFKQAGSPHYIQSDQGKEFENQTFLSFLKEHHVKQFSVKSPYKSGMVERFNRTLKTRMFRYFTHVGNYKWVNVLPDLVDSYNLGEHRSLPKGMSPKQASDPRRHSEVFRHQEQGGKSIAKQNTSIKIGDVVRISKYKGIFQKGYVANFSEEVFTIKAIDQRYQPITYTIMDEKQEIIEGKFYAHELQVVKPNEWYAVEKVIRHQGKKTLVKFLGYPDEYWVDNVKDINK